MADTADTADIMANKANILARCRREADTSSAAAHWENTATGEVETGVAVIGEAIGGIIDSPVTDSSSPVDLVIRTTGIGTLLGAGAFLTRITAIILISIIRMTVAPYQEGNSLGPDSGRAGFALSKAGWSWGCVSAIDSSGRTIFVASADDRPLPPPRCLGQSACRVLMTGNWGSTSARDGGVTADHRGTAHRAGMSLPLRWFLNVRRVRHAQKRATTSAMTA
jgi:hypothetical protein